MPGKTPKREHHSLRSREMGGGAEQSTSQTNFLKPTQFLECGLKKKSQSGNHDRDTDKQRASETDRHRQTEIER